MSRLSATAILCLAALPLCAQTCEPLPALKDAASNGVVPAAAREEYRAQRDAHPADLAAQTQYARALTGTATPEAIQILEGVLEKQIGYPAAHLQLALIYNSPSFRDAAKVKSHLESYWKACPSSIFGSQYAARTDDESFMRRTAARLRPLIEAHDDDPSLTGYRTLWPLEFKITPLSKQDALREQVRKDVARLRKVDISKHPAILSELSEAYKLLDDEEGAKWVEANRPASTRPGSSTALAAITAWHGAHPIKGDYQVYSEEVARQSEQWIQQWPDDPYPRMERFNALRTLRDSELEERVKAAEEWVRVYEAHPAGPLPYMDVATFFESNSMRYAELPGLVDKGLKSVGTFSDELGSDLNRVANGPSLPNSRWNSWNTAARVYIKVKRYDDARKILASWIASLRENRSADGRSEAEKRMIGQSESLYWDDMARLAHAEGHRLDEMVYQRNSGLVSPSSSTMNGEPHGVYLARQIWRDLGGTDEGFQAWTQSSASTAKRV